jgi:hypothetical protein
MFETRMKALVLAGLLTGGEIERKLRLILTLIPHPK